MAVTPFSQVTRALGSIIAAAQLFNVMTLSLGFLLEAFP